ncbi:endogenous retrovirus group K member 8 Rec protein-like [Ochotona princeps]|uniref:endogenous retrovirus group K member 8 Rec protein-like n=1 Tax=Ochotona princeps TaxID=9978 RepID=UPI002714FCF8|nr:endogenous retrovirus group K member 8 Rec protein-like [Ochotona princeps]
MSNLPQIPGPPLPRSRLRSRKRRQQQPLLPIAPPQMPVKCPPESSPPESIAPEKPDLSATEEFLPILMSGLQLRPPPTSHPQAASTRRVSPPTWGQIKALTSSAQRLVISQQRPCTPDNLFVAMLAILTIQSSSDV